ncbi:MAG: CHASE domain-containing protein [Magnetococcales bacterium]|nr:CHASE domain-containing protein [Magnetococcales bacterium]
MIEKRQLIRRIMKVVLMSGVAFSVAGALFTDHLVRKIHQKEFEKDAIERFEAIQLGVRQYLNVVEDIRGLFAASHHVARDEFGEYVRPILERQKGFQALSWNLLVPGGEREAFEARVARDQPGFRIIERLPQGMVTPSRPRAEHIVVYYIEPFASNEKAFGFDVASDPVRLAAFELARDSGRTAVTPPVRLLQEAGNQKGALFIHPVYENGQPVRTVEERRTYLKGFAVGVVRFGDLIESAIIGLSPRGVTFWLYDTSPSSAENFLHLHVTRLNKTSKASDVPPVPPPDAMKVIKAFPVANRQWRFTAVHHHGHEGGVHYFIWSVVVVPLVGLGFTGLLLAFLRRMQHEEQRRQAWEASLGASEEQKRTIIENAPFGIVVVDAGERILEFNLAAEQLFGHVREEIVGRPVGELVPPALRTAHQAGFQRFRETGADRILGLAPFETEALHKDGRIFPIRLAVNRMAMPSGVAFVGMIADITEEKQIYSELIQSEKMAGLGNMVAGVAHEINTPVGIGVTAASELEERTRVFADLLHKEGISEEELKAYLASTLRLVALTRGNLERAADLVRSFKLVAVDQSSEKPRAFKVRECVEAAVLTLQHELRKTQLLVRVSCPHDLEIQGYPGAISQIVINLVNNSRLHAFGPEDQGTIGMEFSVDGDFLAFSYRDDGQGMPEEVLQRIFEPFYTTRRDLGGSGLGLHIVYNLVVQTLGGTIACHSAVGRGVHFSIRIPLRAVENQPTGDLPA